ncbi:MAG: VWA domain-containing protein [Acidimicrobiia bacterium]|nr:VWA domain-containing protein [Acidimicrobiia bacterium]
MRLVLVAVAIGLCVVEPFDARPAGLAGRLLAQSAADQAPQAPAQPIFRATTDLVRVDVTATSRNEPVGDLTIDDFEITDDEVPQRIETIQFIRVDGTRTSNLDEPLEIRSKEHALLEAAREDVRLFGIFLDDYHIAKRPDITLPLRDTLTKFINQLGPNDLVALMDPLTTLYDLKYTRNKAELISRIRSFEGRLGETFPIKSPIEEAQLSQRNWMELRSGVTLSALKALALNMGGLRDGRKSLLFFSQGPGVRPGSPNDQLMKEIDRAANQGNVSIHVIDPRPLGSAGFGGGTVLRRLAADTNGRTIVNTNEPMEQLKDVVSDASAYYLLGYTPTRRTNDGRFHEIKVRVKRRGVQINARRGYWSASAKEITAAAEAAATPPNAALTTALAALSDSVNTRAVAVWTGVARGDGGHTRVTYTWEPNPTPGSDKPARLEIQPVDDAGKPTRPAQVIGGAPGELPLMARFDWPGGRHRVRFTSLAANGDIIDRWVQVQAVADLSKQPIVLATPKILRAKNMVEFRAIEANPSASPTAATRFSATDRVLVDIELQAPAGAPQLKVDLLNSRGDVLRALDAPPLVDGKARMAIPVGSLANSTYVLRIAATSGEHAAEQWVAFRVSR